MRPQKANRERWSSTMGPHKGNREGCQTYSLFFCRTFAETYEQEVYATLANHARTTSEICSCFTLSKLLMPSGWYERAPADMQGMIMAHVHCGPVQSHSILFETHVWFDFAWVWQALEMFRTERIRDKTVWQTSQARKCLPVERSCGKYGKREGAGCTLPMNSLRMKITKT